MVSAAQRRDAARSLQSHFRVSERRACRVIRLSRAVCRYVSVRPPQDALRQRIREIAETRIRYGYLRIHTLLRREGLVVNRKRVHRLYCLEGLQLRPRRPRRHVSAAHRARPQRTARARNDAWAMDFVAERCHGGRKLRMLTVVDVCTRECLAIDPGHRMGGEDVARTLQRIVAERGAPKRVFCDNGSEFQSRLVDLWAYQHKVCLEFSRPGKPTDNAHIESFNGRLRDECLNTHWFDDLTQARAVIDAWRIDYNESRPHKALKQLTPREYSKQLMQKNQKFAG